MPIDPYSLCPGGTGKKIKFCCKDLLSELDKIGRMLEGEQFVACLNFVERVRQTYPDRECLLATQILLQRMTGLTEEAKQAAGYFLEKHPDNPIALAESAMVAGSEKGGRAALPALQRAVAASGEKLSSRVYEVIGAVTQMLLEEGHYLAARTLALFLATVNHQDERAVELLMRLNAVPSVPLIVKDGRGLQRAAEDSPFAKQTDEAIALASTARWPEAIEKLEHLTEQYPEAPVPWRNLGRLRAWSADTEAAIQTLRKYASLDVPLEDAVEAEALGLMLRDDPLGDQVDLVELTYTVNDAEAMQAALAGSTRAAMAPANPAAFADTDSPPPKSTFLLFDRPAPDADAELTLDNVPRVLCQGMFYGKETDREARLHVIDVVDSDVRTVTESVVELAAGAVDAEPQREKIGEASRSRELLSRRWRLPDGSSQEQFRRLADAYLEDALLGQWAELPLGVFEERSPRQVVEDQSCRARLLAAIMLVEYWLDQSGADFDCNRLRTRLGLPTMEPIVPAEGSVATMPLVRLARVEADNLGDEDILNGYRRAVAYGAQAAAEKFGRELIQRPSMAGREERFQAYRVLARMAAEPEETLRLLNKGREEVLAAGGSCATWDLLEMSFHFEHANPEGVGRLLDHLEQVHSNEPGVMEALAQLLVKCGVLNPDGTSAMPMAPAPSGAAGEEPSIVVPGDSGDGSGEIWTPDGQAGGGDNPKIWTPDMG